MPSPHPRRLALALASVGLLALSACNGGGSDPGSPPLAAVRLTRVFEGLSFSSPVQLLQAPGDAGRWYVVEQGGIVKTFENGATPAAPTTFVDLSARIDAAGEMGLLGMAFHPDWPATPEVFLNFVPNDVLRSHVVRLSAREGNLLELDPATEQLVLAIDQPAANHNGGGLAFGPDGFLYLGFGDGGGVGDPQNRAQTLTTLLGKFLRIDVDGTGAGYEIPADNPFAGNAQCTLGTTPAAPCPEIWAFGFRNPWRWSFDRETGQLWAGDVGQSSWEEIDVVEKGLNYGWRFREGAHCFSPASGCPVPGDVENGAPIVDPVAEYGRDLGTTVTGGYVYRGAAVPGLRGRYVFGDFGSGRIWTREPGAPGLQMEELLDTDLSISSFAEDLAGELYAVDYGGGLYRLDAAGTAAAAPGARCARTSSQ
jgi:glucose/arabinose dehydrogenase